MMVELTSRSLLSSCIACSRRVIIASGGRVKHLWSASLYLFSLLFASSCLQGRPENASPPAPARAFSSLPPTAMTGGPALCPRPGGGLTACATLGRALRATHNLTQQGATSKRRLTVWVRGDSSSWTNHWLSGPDDSELELATSPGEPPVLSGGRPVASWRQTTLGEKDFSSPISPPPPGASGHSMNSGSTAGGRGARHPDHGYLAVAELPDKAPDSTKGNSRFRSPRDSRPGTA